MTLHDTLCDIVAKYAPERINQIVDKYIVETDYRASEQYGTCTTTIREDWTTLAFDSETDAHEFISMRTAKIREDVKSYLDPRKDIRYAVSFGYKKVPCIIVGSDTDIDLDLGSADFTDNSDRVAYYCLDEFLDNPESIQYDNYEFSGSDPIT